MALLGGVVVGVDLRPELDLLDLDPRLLLTRLLLADVPLVLELAVIHDPADRRLGLRGDLDQIEIEILGALERVLDLHDSDLGPVGTDEPNLGGPDPIVDARLNRDPASPPGGERKSTDEGSSALE